MSLDERDWLITIVKGATRPRGCSCRNCRATVTDSGFDFTKNQGEFVYEIKGKRFEVTVKELHP